MSASSLELILKLKKLSGLNPDLVFPLYSLEESLELFRGESREYDIPGVDPKNNYNIFLRVKKTALENPEPSEGKILQDVSVFVNDILIGTTSADTRGSVFMLLTEDGLNLKQEPESCLHEILKECYGMIQFSVTVTMKETGDVNYRSGRYLSDFIPIIWDNDTKADIDAMIRYIDKYDKELPLTDLDPEAKRASANYPVRISQSGKDSLDDIWFRENETDERVRRHKWSTDIQLAKRISSVYERNYGYFRTHPATAIKKENRVSQIERMQVVTPDTLRYISRHPEYLERNDRYGIPIGDHKYTPQKAMMSQNITSADTYENRMSLGFLGSVIQGLQTDAADLSDELKGMKERKTEGSASGGYANALKQQIQELEDWERMLSAVLDQMNRKLIMYRSALGLEVTSVRIMPRATDIFLSVRPYREIFDCMKLWFNFRDYGLDRNELYLPLTRLSNLYERYFLTLLVRYFDHRFWKAYGKDFSMKSSLFFYQRPSGPKSSKKDWEEPDNISNTFIYSGLNKDTLTLYYQPVIYTWEGKKEEAGEKGKPKDNGIGLHRNNLVSFNIFNEMLQDADSKNDEEILLTKFENTVKDNIRFYFYRPDFLIKLESEGSPDRYVILDTKFCNRDNVIKYEVKELFYKYVLSLSADYDPECLTQDPYPGNKETERVYIVYGQHAIDGTYDVDPDRDTNRYPYMGLLPIFATPVGYDDWQKGEENNFKTLDKIFDLLCKDGI